MPTMSDIVDLEEALSKTGAELFKELYRIYPVAEPEDYFKQGQWKNEVMKTDIVMVEAHRRECGAPDVPHLDDIKPPDLPEGYSPAFVGFAPVIKPAGLTMPLQAGISVAGSAPVVEIRLIALFVAKWKLDPVKAKSCLAKLTPTRRRYIIQNFKTEKTGVEATEELETYIAECELDGAWDKQTAANGAAAAVVNGATSVSPLANMPTVGKIRPQLGGISAVINNLKRPVAAGLVAGVAPNPAFMQNKRPTLTPTISPGMVRPKAGGGIIGNLLSGF